jgi:hypothetical protein
MKQYFAFPKFCQEVHDRIVEGEDGVRGWRRLRLLNRDFRNNQKGGFELGVAIKQLVGEGRIVFERRYPNGQKSEGYAVVNDPVDDLGDDFADR